MTKLNPRSEDRFEFPNEHAADRDKLDLCWRMQQRLIDQFNAQGHLDRAALRAFRKGWDHRVYRLHRTLNVIKARVRELPGYELPQDEAKDDPIIAAKRQARADTRFDAEIDAHELLRVSHG